MFTKRWHQTMDQDTETTQKSRSTFKVSTRESLKNIIKIIILSHEKFWHGSDWPDQSRAILP